MTVGTAGLNLNDPSAALGTISANEWSSYLQNFLPQTQQLMNYATSNQQVQTNMQTGLGLQEGANAQEAGMQTRRLQQFDTTLNPQEAAAAKEQTGLGNVLSNVQAENKAKDVTVANQMGIMGAQNSGITGGL